jgi:endonuclease YncB( thermonuclease family)
MDDNRPRSPLAEKRARGEFNPAGIVRVGIVVAAILLIGQLRPSSWLQRNFGVGRIGNAEPFMPVRERMVRPLFSPCQYKTGPNCTVDGASFWMNGVNYRIADIDPPQPYPSGCAREANQAGEATARLAEELQLGEITLGTPDPSLSKGDPHRRTVFVGGKSVGERMIALGLAKRPGTARNPWCDPPADADVRRDGKVRPLRPVL